MNVTVKKRWLAALRSGEYRQTRTALRRGADLRCCLGVLCDVSGVGEWDKHTYVGTAGDRDAVMPPCTVQSTVGITDGHCRRLVELNDLEAQSFEQIADYIEGHL